MTDDREGIDALSNRSLKVNTVEFQSLVKDVALHSLNEESLVLSTTSGHWVLEKHRKQVVHSKMYYYQKYVH